VISQHADVEIGGAAKDVIVPDLSDVDSAVTEDHFWEIETLVPHFKRLKKIKSVTCKWCKGESHDQADNVKQERNSNVARALLRRTNQPTDRPTDGRPKSLMEALART
jgi:hypothetical protein